VFFESFTASAERAMRRAEQLARRQSAQTVGPLDLLAALAAESESRASELMVELGVEMDRLWAGLGPGLAQTLDESAVAEREGGHAEGEGPRISLPISPDLRQVLNEAMVQARGSDRGREVGTEHLLAGLLTESGPPAELLRAAGLELETLRERLTEVVEVDTGPLPLADGIPPLELFESDNAVDLGRILDASVNRAREGLRVIEDYVRFVLDDPGLTRRLKEVRHRLAQAERGLDEHLLLGSRDTPNDVGTHIMTPSEQIRETPRAVLAANFKRIAEALRSLEEYSKLVNVWLAGRFEVLRYDVYTLEKLIMTAVFTQKTLGETRLMVLVGGLTTLGDLTWVVGEAIAGGADAIQYREKGLSDRELLSRARELRILTAQARIPFIMNDRVDLARLARADGVHVGQEDLSVRDARRVLGPSAQVSSMPRSCQAPAIWGWARSFRAPPKISPSLSSRVSALFASPPRRRHFRGSRSVVSTKAMWIGCSKQEPRGSP
jgi:thiamine-phosphate pyrophosphorylase